MFEAVGLLVDKLSRTQFGNLDVSGLRPVSYTHLDVYKRQSMTREPMDFQWAISTMPSCVRQKFCFKKMGRPVWLAGSFAAATAASTM